MGVPTKLTTSPIYGLPSVAVPVPAAILVCKIPELPVGETTAEVVASYTLVNGTDKPEKVNALGVIIALAGVWIVSE